MSGDPAVNGIDLNEVNKLIELFESVEINHLLENNDTRTEVIKDTSRVLKEILRSLKEEVEKNEQNNIEIDQLKHKILVLENSDGI